MHERLRFFAQSVTALCPAFFIGYVIMIIAWPWAALAPLNPVRGLIDFGEFHYHIRTLLNGQIYEMANVPRWYEPAYLLIKLPLVIVAGVGAALLATAQPGQNALHKRRAETLLLAGIATFPVICEVIDRGPAFTGVRHFLFVVPAFAALTGIGFDWLLTHLAVRRVWLARAAGAAVALAIAWDAGLLIRLHPYQYLFYNPLVGGLEGAAGRYDTDYWVNIMPEAVDDLEDFVAKLDDTGGTGHRYSVSVCGERLPFEKEANAQLQWTDDWNRAEFFIAPTHMNCDRALDGKILATISRMGVKIGVVKDRRALLHKTVAGAQ
jgi:hypothetical protein